MRKLQILLSGADRDSLIDDAMESSVDDGAFLFVGGVAVLFFAAELDLLQVFPREPIHHDPQSSLRVAQAISCLAGRLHPSAFVPSHVLSRESGVNFA